MRRFVIALLLTTAPALAEEPAPDLAQVGMIQEMHEGRWDGLLWPPADSFWTELSNAAGTFRLNEVELSDIERRFGGKRQAWEGFAGTIEYLCYVVAGQRVWYLAEEDGYFDWVVAEPSDPATDARHGCTENSQAALTGDAFPAIGATLEEVAAQFNWPLEPNTDRVAFTMELPEDDYFGRTVYYRLKDGVVDGVSFIEGVP